ncbi:MAG TPA: serine hydrolase [Elusimicrobiota bacterium]|jgi:beta-lactamase class A|nr:serine hydrolase [Elusimicrobiota bacterium]
MPAPVRAAPPRYDVSYLWHATLPVALQRRQAVAKVLGRRAARKLRVVSVDGAYAVVSLRSGGAKAAAAAAAAQSRRLKRDGLGKAWALPARSWTEVPPRRPSPAARTVATSAALKPSSPPIGNRRLEDLLDAHVKELRRRGRLSPDERTAWSVYDFTTGQTLVEINADLELQSASLVKPFLALAFMSQVGKGRLVYDDESRRQMTRMIQVSDNEAADWIMRRLGGPAAVQRLLRTEFGRLLPGVEIREYIPRDGRTYRNKASARDYSRFLLALWRDELPGSGEIKRLMALPKRDRLRTGVPLPRDVEVYDKTGTTSRLCGDIGVLTAKGPDGRQYAYTLIGIIEKDRRARDYASWMRSRGNVIRYVSYLVYRSVGALHGFASARWMRGAGPRGGRAP